MRSNYKIWIAASAVMAAALSCAWLPDVAEAASADVKLSPKTVTLQMKVTAKKTTYGKKKIKVKKAKGVTIQKVTYKSGNKSVATVTKKGLVKAKKKGSAKIAVTVRYKKAGKTKKARLSCTVKVKRKVVGDIPLKSFTISCRDVVLNGDGTASKEVEVAMKPTYATEKISFRGDNDTVATVDAKGTVTGKMMGTVTVTAVSESGKTAECPVVVRNPSLEIHDPSVYRDPVSGKYYTFGSHLTAGYSSDLIGWTNMGSNYRVSNLFTKKYTEEFAEPYAFTMPDGANENAWAPDIIYNEAKKKYYMYISIVDGSRKCCIAMAESDKPDGPYSYKDMIVCSGIANDIEKTNVAEALGITEEQAKASKYATLGEKSPDCIDATVFFDHDGNLWLVYGSFTTEGGIRLLKLDKETGLRGPNYEESEDATADALGTSDPYYGLKIANKNGEGPYIQELKDSRSSTGYYYYLWTSVGGLRPHGGYNMRMVRAENVEGPYTDPKGNAATSTLGRSELGLRVIDNYKFSFMDLAYTSCGGNSAVMDEQGRTFIHFHQKFAHTVENFVVRTHQTFSNEDGWLVTAPFEFNGETIADSYDKEDVAGRYEFIYHRTEFQSTTPPFYDYVESQGLTLNEDGTVSGAYEGTWTLKGHYITIAINNQEYKGVVLEQYEQTNARDKVMVFTAIGSDNRTIWGSKTHKTDEEAVEYDAAQLTVPETAAEDFDLPTEGLFGSTVTWTSDSKALAVENGTAKLSPGVKEEKATLTAVVTRGGSSKTLTFTVAVEPISLLISPVVKGTSIELPAKIGEYDIAWSSSDASVINPETGAVTPPAAKAAVVTLTAKFGSEERTFDVTVLPLAVSSYIWQQDYNSVTDAASVWTSDNAQDKVVLASDEAHGKYIQFTPERNNSRGAVTDFGISDKLSGGIYTVEFDVSLKAGDNQTTEFALTGTDLAYSNNIINDGIDSGYIFKMSSEVNSTKWSINGADAVDIPADWVHVLAAVDPSKKAASVVISKDDTIYFNEAVAINGNGVLKGMYVRGGRYDSVTKVDNIQVY